MSYLHIGLGSFSKLFLLCKILYFRCSSVIKIGGIPNKTCSVCVATFLYVLVIDVKQILWMD